MLKVEELAKAGKLNDAELFIFTDNLVFEGTVFRGHSKLKKLNDISSGFTWRKRRHAASCM